MEKQESIEVQGLEVYDNRSSFFFHDKAFFDLLQPVEGRELVKRRTRVPDELFRRYPELINEQKALQAGNGAVTLSDDYWSKARPVRQRHGERHLAYLFLAGFNQNIVDFMNQEASEVLDSLDPIYPGLEEQEEEGFFVRYANPRAMITYVPRSRTLEVGNDYIGTCPYAFLIHALAMHNEALTREQEAETFEAIDAIRDAIENGDYVEAEQRINTVRRNAFEKYERYRYRNPFRYDTERDVFEELENLRGTSRLKGAYERALIALEEAVRDLDREQKRKEAAIAEKEQKRREEQDRWLSILFGVLGVSGIIQVAYQIDEFARGHEGSWVNRALGAAYFIGPVILAYLAYRFIRNRRQ